MQYWTVTYGDSIHFDSLVDKWMAFRRAMVCGMLHPGADIRVSTFYDNDMVKWGESWKFLGGSTFRLVGGSNAILVVEG